MCARVLFCDGGLYASAHTLDGFNRKLVVGFQVILLNALPQAGLCGFDQFFKCQSTMLVLRYQTHHELHVGLHQSCVISLQSVPFSFTALSRARSSSIVSNGALPISANNSSICSFVIVWISDANFVKEILDYSSPIGEF